MLAQSNWCQSTHEPIRISNFNSTSTQSVICIKGCKRLSLSSALLKGYTNSSRQNLVTVLICTLRAQLGEKLKVMAAADQRSSLPEDSLFLGFDISIQSLKATVLDSNLRIVLSETVHFDSELPHYKTKDGVYRDLSGNGRVVSSPLMWIEALDLILNKLKKAELKFDKVRAISGSGKHIWSIFQHFLVYQLS